jgi:hypothetical protein
MYCSIETADSVEALTSYISKYRERQRETEREEYVTSTDQQT